MTPQILYNRRWSRNNPTTSSKGKEHYKTILDRRLSGTIYQSNPLDDPKGNRVVLSSFRRGKIRLTSLGTILQSKGLHKVSPSLFFSFSFTPLLCWEEDGKSARKKDGSIIRRWRYRVSTLFVEFPRAKHLSRVIDRVEKWFKTGKPRIPCGGLRIDSRRGKLLECEFPGNLLYNTFLLSLFFFLIFLYIYMCVCKLNKVEHKYIIIRNKK